MEVNKEENKIIIKPKQSKERYKATFLTSTQPQTPKNNYLEE